MNMLNGLFNLQCWLYSRYGRHSSCQQIQQETKGLSQLDKRSQGLEKNGGHVDQNYEGCVQDQMEAR